MRSYSSGLVLILLVTGLTACGDQQSKSNSQSTLSLESSSSRVANADSSLPADAKLINIDFQTVRRLERYIDTRSSAALPSEENMLVLAKKAAFDLNPGTQLQVLNIRRGRQFTYVTFQQYLGDREVVGSKLTLRLNDDGRWLSTSSTLVHPNLLVQTPAKTSIVIDSNRYYSASHQVLSEKSVVFPKLSEAGVMNFYGAREIVVLDTQKNKEYWLWIDEATEKALAVLNPQSDIDEVTMVGNIVPGLQTEGDTLEAFPGISALFGNSSRLFSDSLGKFRLGALSEEPARIALENNFVSVSKSPYQSIKAWGVEYSLPSNPIETTTERGVVFKLENVDSEGKFNINDGFSLQERNVFFWVTKARDFVVKYLKYSGADFHLTATTDDLEEADNASFSPLSMALTFGAGAEFFKNTALSKSIIVHEYTHAITNSIYGFVFTYEFSAMNEAFSDYFAADIANDPRVGAGDMQDSTGRPYLRIVDNDFKYPDFFSAQSFHSDGQMFSGALWDLRKKIGAKEAALLIHEARLAQPRTIREFLMELLAVDEDRDDQNPLTPSKNKKAIISSFFRHGLHSNVAFDL